MTAYFNENDPFAAQWLRNLIERGLIAKGHVDDRSIEEVTPGDLAGFTQCHFFAGIGGWSLALRLAGWHDARPVWTGSCPCQPFSEAGARGGDADERHLWPTWSRLVRECRPRCILGEQVASFDGLAWLDLVFADLEDAGYAVAAADLCAAGAGAPHIRHRLYWLADADRVLAAEPAWQGHRPRETDRAGATGQPAGHGAHAPARAPRATHHEWSDADWLRCRDERWRPVEPGTCPLADGIPGRVGRLRAYGNAVVPPLAATFVRACLDARS
jgi:DNA (cytosine-5)-methyltransferase 1